MSGLLILGLGNVLCGDDGAGVAAVEQLRRRYVIPKGAQVRDGGTLGLSLLPLLRGFRRVILADAVAARGEPGTLVRLEGRQVASAAAGRLSVHQVGVADLLEANALLGGGPRRIVLWGIIPASIVVSSFGLSSRVSRGIPALAAALAQEAAASGFSFEKRRTDESDREAGRGGDLLLGALGLPPR